MENPPVKAAPQPPLEHVTDAYYRYTDVIFHWTKHLKPEQAAAVGALINGHALVHPDHPLHIPGEKGIKLYHGTDEMGKPRLLLSLRQMEYLQYYIYEMRLATPSWVEYHAKRAELTADGKAEATDKLVAPSREDGKDDWVPLPDSAIPASFFVNIESINFESELFLRLVYKQIQKDGKQAARNKRLGYDPPKYTLSRFDAIEDNMTPGLGLRSGPMREQTRRPKDVDEPVEGTGWGGFPVTRGDDKADRATEISPAIETESTDNPTLASPVEFDVVAPPLSPSTSPKPTTPSEDLGMRYHYHCQQAFLLAISGGLASTIPSASKPSEDDEDGEAAEETCPPEIGRSLFISLAATRWEKDPKVILEIGYSAIWWQARPEGYEPQEGGLPFEEMRDFGHFIISDHLLSKKNGNSRPDYRDDYLFGDSLPLEASKIRSAIQQKIKELTAKAGNGPIYVVTHVTEGKEADFTELGLNASSGDVDLQPDGWDVPPYLCVAGCQSVFVINTATLFGSVEGASSPESEGVVQQVGRTKKSLQHTALLLFNEDGRRPEKCGNAGNDAFYTLEIFLSLMAGPPLPKLRETYARTQNQASTHDVLKKEDGDGDGGVSIVQTVPLSTLTLDEKEASARTLESRADDDAEGEREAALLDARDGYVNANGDFDQVEREVDGSGDQEEDEDYMDGEEIMGVYYEDEEGNMVELSD